MPPLSTPAGNSVLWLSMATPQPNWKDKAYELHKRQHPVLRKVIVAVIGAVAVVASGRWGGMSEVYDDRPDMLVLDLSQVRDVPPPLVKGAVPAQGAVAYVCHGATCLPAMRSVDEVVAALS